MPKHEICKVKNYSKYEKMNNSIYNVRFNLVNRYRHGGFITAFKFPLNLYSRKRYLVGMILLQPLAHAGFSTYLVGPSALYMYFKRRSGKWRNENTGKMPAVLWVETEASLVDLSRLFEDIRFPGAVFFDAAMYTGNTLVLFRCIEPGHRPVQATLQGAFRYELGRGVFHDPLGAYPFVSEAQLRFDEAAIPAASGSPSPLDGLGIIEIALLIAHFGYKLPKAGPAGAGNSTLFELDDRQSARLSAPEQRFLLSGVLTGPHSAAALQFLMDSGFITRYWPLLADMDSVAHSKEHHPEGNVWKHTLETFSHRKVFELELGLGLLLHDCGKPYAQPQGGNRFDQHAQIGSQKTRRFLEQLQFPHPVIQAVEYLVKNHMLPSAISSLPTFRTEEVMASSLFPELLELYRCDVSATFRGPDGYYRACKTYRTFLKNSRNPFRSSDGKKRLRLLVE